MSTKTIQKRAESLRVSDFRDYPVWEFVNDDGLGETVMRPVKRLPVASLDNRLVGLEVRLANGDTKWGFIGNFDVKSRRHNEHLLSLTVFNGRQRFHLARYHDFLYSKYGPRALTRFLGLAVVDVFPIAYDLRPFVKGRPSVLRGEVTKNAPSKRLSRFQLFDLA